MKSENIIYLIELRNAFRQFLKANNIRSTDGFDILWYGWKKHTMRRKILSHTAFYSIENRGWLKSAYAEQFCIYCCKHWNPIADIIAERKSQQPTPTAKIADT